MEIIFPHDEFLHGKILRRNPTIPSHPNPNAKKSLGKSLYIS